MKDEEEPSKNIENNKKGVWLMFSATSCDSTVQRPEESYFMNGLTEGVIWAGVSTCPCLYTDVILVVAVNEIISLKDDQRLNQQLLYP